jgi:hypothetical protein
MCFVDNEGNILVPKTVRPLIEYKQTLLGEKRGSKKQYRHGNLHIREYESYYSVHCDKIDPHKDPLGHILVDAAKYFPGIMMLSAFSDYLINREK